ncbi:DUF819 family protein [Maribacter hydrothermalis]|uniref:DUF819 family protein n=1 Tax=Maribacter hydrothermalis TaxID=1836467 RepID=A0A1B7Z474_9FLAO|nr:DUF819 family protein [Maribacter hydrothermalis]APQ17235.1 hypothetical protein BTR34_07780 [Maribacter hydrothermalis]OBR37494.1 hypothetical protein A9200_07530 [Maribacter hydrothermalis]
MIIPWVIATFTVFVVYFLDRWENKHIKSLFDWVPAILLAYIIPAIISYLLKVDYSQASIHDFSKDYFIPLAIIAVMSSLSLSQLKAIGLRPIIVFASGSLFIAVFPVILMIIFSETDLIAEILVTDQYWMGIPPIVGSWIGGSTSQLVLKELVECPENIFLIVLVMDTILVNVWTIIMFQSIKKSNILNRWFKITDVAIPEDIRVDYGNKLGPIISVAVVLGVVILCNFLIDSFVIKVVLLSLLGLALSNFIPSWNYRFALKIGGILIIVVMAVLGLKLQIATLGFNMPFLGFLIVWLVGHFLFMIGVAKLLNVNMAWVPIASMANVGGIATAPAVTAAYNLKWMPHAIVLAILSMATGTFWGMLTIWLLRNFVA